MRTKFLFTILILILVLFLFSSSGLAQYFGKNKVQYKSFEWYFIQTRHFDIYYYQNGYGLAEFAAEVLEDAYLIVSDQLDYDLQKRVPVILYNSPNEFQQTNVIPQIIEEGVGGFTESFKNRIVVPFNGSYEDFRHVLHHELTHAFTYDMLYGNVLGSLLSRQYLFRLPLWFAEGFAEYSSRGGWDMEADMVIRDATINGYLFPLDYVGGYLAYKEGQSAILYLVEKYGKEKIAEILSKGRTHISMDKALEVSIGMNVKKFSEEWMKHLRKKYWPEIAERKEPEDFAKQLTFHREDGSFINEKPAFSPQGDRIAIFSDRSDYTEIYIISAVDGKVIDKLAKSGRSGDLESLHSYVSGLSWSPDGMNLVFVTKTNGRDVLSFINVKKKKIYKRVNFNFDALLSPHWSSDGEKIVFVGLKSGATDLYLYDLKKEELKELTSDPYDDEEPAWSQDGKYIAFSSDRPIEELSSDSAEYLYGDYNLFLLETDSDKIIPLTRNKGNNFSPTWSPDSKKICFVSNKNGINNLYVKDLDSNRIYPITNVLSGCFTPSWSKKEDRIAFSYFYQGGWDIFLLKELKPVEPPFEPLPKTPYLLSMVSESVVSDTMPGEPFPEQKEYSKEREFSSYVFKAGETELDSLMRKVTEEEGKLDTLAYKLPSGDYKRKKYKLRFTPDLVSGALSYDTFFGFRGQSFVMFSDIFGNHNFLLATDLINTIDQSNFQFFYQYLTRRLDLGAGIFHTKYYYIDSWDRLFSDRIYGATAFFSLPFSKYTRIQSGMTYLAIDRKYYDPNPYTNIFDDNSVKVSPVDFSWVKDNVIWGHTGPVNGSRRILTLEYSPEISDKSISYYSIWFDYRKYWHFAKRYNFVLRLSAGRSDGDDPKLFYLGGISNWIGPKLGDSDIYEIGSLYFAHVVTPLRGYRYYEVYGTRFALANLEFRYPFVEHLAMKFPLPFALSYVNGNIFMDIGAAWKRWDPDREVWIKTTREFKGGTSQDGSRLKDIKAGFGFGARANLGFFVLRFDTAWRTDFDWVSAKPEYYFSLGAEF
ncbi:MAG: hypothetical protein AMJ90_08675 [candidate division Zixibacteria bacterium SM23_73_2]|nr:MAG: hypothetical protein AMJ90_08675 [candidate division Zixibacteria bacterium SM23_73_2]